MTAKKDPGRFTVRFNLHDPSHREAVALLEKQGSRTKANYIANAVLHYEHDHLEPVKAGALSISRSEIETIVLEVLARQPSARSLNTVPPEPPAGKPSVRKAPAPDHADDETTLEFITDALAAFKGQ